MTRSAPDVPRIVLQPLNQDELNCVLALLAANLSRSNQCKKLTAIVGAMKLASPISVDFKEIQMGNAKKKTRQAAWELTAEKYVLKAQQKWRAAAHGPDSINDKIVDFDLYQLENYRDFRIPSFTIKNEHVYQSRKLFHPSLCVRIESVVDIFDWLLIRAAVNRQLSRFVHCVVCGKWILKERAGKRSVRVREYALKHGNPSAWPEFMYSLPSWPGICKSRVCQSKFASVFPDKKRKRPRSQFHIKDFVGLRADQGTRF